MRLAVVFCSGRSGRGTDLGLGIRLEEDGFDRLHFESEVKLAETVLSSRMRLS
jgi:hypothetical protein